MYVATVSTDPASIRFSGRPIVSARSERAKRVESEKQSQWLSYSQRSPDAPTGARNPPPLRVKTVLPGNPSIFPE